MIYSTSVLKSVLNDITSEIVAIDTETTGLRPFHDDFRMVSFGINDGTNSWVVLTHPVFNSEHINVRMDGWQDVFNKWVENKKVVMHNAKYDLQVFKRYGVNIKCWYDTMIAARMTNNLVFGQRTSLKDIALKYFRDGRDRFKDLIDARNKSNKEMLDAYKSVDFERFVQYLIDDVEDTYRAYQLTESWLNEWSEKTQIKDAFFNIEMPLVHVVAEMEENGILLDQERFSGIRYDWYKKRDSVYRQLKDFADINFNSVPQLQGFIYSDFVTVTDRVTKKIVLKGLGMEPTQSCYNKRNEIRLTKKAVEQLIGLYGENNIFDLYMGGMTVANILKHLLEEYIDSDSFNVVGKSSDYLMQYLFSDSVSIIVSFEETKTIPGLNLDPLKREDGGLTSGGQPSTSARTLKKLADKHPNIRFLSLLQRYNEYDHTITSFIDPVLDEKRSWVDTDGKVRASFNQIDADTTRFTCSNPNLQQMPKMSDIRSIFISTPGDLMCARDYSQMELRVCAHIFDVQAMIDEYNKDDADLHSRTASACGISRKNAKVVNFGILYGKTEYSLSEDLGISKEEAREYITRFYEAYPEIYNGVENCYYFILSNGYIPLYYGHIRQFDLPFDEFPGVSNIKKLEMSNGDVKWKLHAIRNRGINTVVQGSSAEIMKMAMIEIQNKFKSYPEHYRAKLLAQIHDEILFSANSCLIEEVDNDVKKIMESVVDFKVPLLSDRSEFKANWGELVGSVDPYSHRLKREMFNV